MSFMNYLYVALLGFLPISELRGSIPAGFILNLNPFFVVLISIIANFLIIPFVYFFLTFFHDKFYKIKIYKHLFDNFLEKKRCKLEQYIGTKFEFLALMLFVGIPLPITGAYTGTLLAWFFKLSKKETYLALGLGILISATIVTILTLLGITLFSLF